MGLDVTDVGLQKKAEGRELKKHSAIIHCSNSLSLLQRKITNALLFHAYKELLVKEEHEINVKQLCKLISYSGNNHAVIKTALKGLISTVIEWNVVNDTTGNEDWTASSVIASVSLQGPTCFYAYSPRMKQLLHSPSMFGKINLIIQSRFKSSYGLALYENSIRYRGLPYTKWFDIDTFRKLMGVPDDKYLIFRDFKRRVLDKSVQEVNTYSDFIIESELFREGRQVTKIRFSLKEREKKVRLGSGNKKPDEENITPEDNEENIKTRLVHHYGFSPEQVQAVFEEYRYDFITEKMALIEASRNYQQGKVHNLAGYLLSALKNNFQAARPSHEVTGKTGLQKKDDSSEAIRLQRVVEQIREEYLVYRESVIDKAIQQLSSFAKEDFIKQFMSDASYPISTVLRLQRNKYTPETIFQSPQIKALLRQSALEKIPMLKNSLISLEQFMEGVSEERKNAWQQFRSLSPDSHLLRMIDPEPSLA